MAVTLKNLVIFVSDLARAESFYATLLGLPVSGKSEMLIEFFPGAATTLGVSLALHEDAKKLVGRHTGITLKVENIADVCESLVQGGARFIEPLESSPWGRMAVVADFDGNMIALVDR
ncbi:MAG TPA: VOC family protein [Desulfuromonadales bacterium]|nr:VOC family protein [Desulfuromonadales bacterium]